MTARQKPTPRRRRAPAVVHRPLGHGGVVHVRSFDRGDDACAVDDHGHDGADDFSSHESGVLCFVGEGDGSARVGDVGVSFAVSGGDVVVIPAGAAHSLRWRRRSSMTAVAVCVTCAGAGVDDGAWRRVRAGASPVVRLGDARWPLVRALLAALHDEQARPSPSTPALLALLQLLLLEVARAADHGASDDDDVVAAALRFVEERCLTPLKPKDVAQALGKSSTHLTTLVRRRTGQPLQAWITAGRMAEARRRLQTSDERIDVVAERVGYGDVRSFVRAFVAATGQTPAVFRRSSARG